MQFFDVITALTISGILTILTLYVTIVYKKGWLKRNHVESHFLCPNQKCRKIFTEPVWLTDLSRTPPESYPACPHCSINLDIIPFFSGQKSPQPKTMQRAPQSFKEFKKPPAIEKTQTIQRETTTEPIYRDVPEPTFSESKSSVQTLEIEDEKPSKPMKQSKMKEEKKPSPSSRDCPHFFGYVRSLPKNTPIPDECLGCSWIVECLTHTAEEVKEVEA